jgi:hypothetical protein
MDTGLFTEDKVAGHEVSCRSEFNPLNSKLNPVCQFLALLGAHPILHVSRIKVKNKWSCNAIPPYALFA